MPSQYRLSRADFKSMRGFKRLHGRLFSLSYGTIPGRAAGAACVVSSKVASRAVDRNKIRRRSRGVLVAILRDVKKPIILVVIAKKDTRTANAQETAMDIRDLCTRACVL